MRTDVCSSHLSDPLALDSELLHLGEVVVKSHHVRDDGLLIWVLCEHIYKTKQRTCQSQPGQKSFLVQSSVFLSLHQA